MTHVARTFMAGLVVILPLILTIAFIAWAGSFAYGYLGPESAVGRLLISIGFGFAASSYVAYGLGALIVAGGIYFRGLAVQSHLAQGVHAITDSLMHRIPLVGSVYDITNRFVGLVGRKDGDALKGMRPVWCFFGGEGGAAVLCLLPTPDLIAIGTTHYHVILVPSPPVPFGGCLIYVPAEWIVAAEIGLEGLMNIYVSMGVSSSKMLQTVRESVAASAT